MKRSLPHIYAAVLLFLALLLVYADLLAASIPPALSALGLDADEYFEVSRSFGYAQLRVGNFPLWNPHLFSGVPYHAGFQSALLYPPNLIYFIMPANRALDIDLLMHLYLMGLGVYGWSRRYTAHPAGAIVAGVTVMLSGPYFLHVLTGHLTFIAAFAWTPYLCWAIDSVLDRPSAKAVTGGVLAVTMMLLAGFPQAAYMSALACACWLLLSIARLRKNSASKLASLSAIAIVPVAIAAGQILPGLEFAHESIRSGGLTLNGSLSWPLHPWDLAEMLFPNMFIGAKIDDYWGGQSMWESGIFFGRLGLIIAVYGLFAAPANGRRPLILVSVLFALVALGPYTPVSPAFYNWIPGFDNFRAVGRYWLIAVLFIAPLLAAGVGALLTNGKRNHALAIGTGILACACWAAYLIVRWSGGDGTEVGASEVWLRVTEYIGETSKSSLDQTRSNALSRLPKSLLATAIVLTMAVPLCLARSRTRWAARALVALACVEMVMFARANRPESHSIQQQELLTPEYRTSAELRTRVLDLEAGNRVMSAGAYNVLGYDPARTRRYLEFIAASQQDPPVSVNEDESSIRITQYHPMLSLLRCAYIQNSGSNDIMVVATTPYPRFLIVPQYEVITERDSLLRRLREPSFNGTETVLLEQEPQTALTGQVTLSKIQVRAESTNYTDLDIHAPSGGILLCTDAYSERWHAVPLAGSIQQGYELLPANWALRAIPLRPGNHRIRMEYDSLSFDLGMAISIATLIATACSISALLAIRLRRSRPPQAN